jgi:hypothetical protein
VAASGHKMKNHGAVQVKFENEFPCDKRQETAWGGLPHSGKRKYSSLWPGTERYLH